MTSLQVSTTARSQWNQSQALSQRIPRVSKTEGSPIQVILTRKGPRAWRNAEYRSSQTKKSNDGRPQTISYRLPKLPENILAGHTPGHSYVYKETFNESQFLLRKDAPPRTAIPLTTVSSYRKSFLPSSVKKQRTSRNTYGDLSFNQNSDTLHSLFPVWKGSSQPHNTLLFPELENIGSKLREPRTPPQSEADVNAIPPVQEIHQHVDEETVKVKDNKVLATKFPVVLAEKSDDERKLTWQLSPYDNKNFDKQGLGPNQGPFSRELPKKCMPPANWLRMKLRHRLHFTKTSHSTIRIR